ncbi:unnamed protein product, partial [Allacma fusca]
AYSRIHLPAILAVSTILFVPQFHASVRGAAKAALPGYLADPFRCLVLLKIGLEVHEDAGLIHCYSKRFLQQFLGSVRQQPYDTILLKSLQAMKIKVGSLYFIERTTVFHFLYAWLSYTISALLVF